MSVCQHHPWYSGSQTLLKTRCVAAQKLHANGRERSAHPYFPSLRKDIQPHGSNRKPAASHLPLEALHNAFARALVTASRCDAHRALSVHAGARSIALHGRDKRGTSFAKAAFRRSFSTRLPVRSPAEGSSPYNTSLEELEKLVDFYETPDEYANARRLRKLKEQAQPRPPRPEPRPKVDETVALAIKLTKLLGREDSTHEELMEAYKALPSPGAAHLDDNTVRRLSNRLSQLPHPTQASKLRVLQVLSDARAANKRVQESAWNSAINFAGKCIKRISNEEVQEALAIWKQMEAEAGVKATDATFNILFDVASKARKFVLADMLLSEMESRGFRMTRFSHVSLIYSYGLRGDGMAVRRAYKDLIDAGHVVDSAVISCVIEAFLKCREPAAAEQTFERAKRLHAAKTGARDPPRGWKEQRELGRLLSSMRMDSRGGGDDDDVAAVVPEAGVAPGVRAYRALVYYYATAEGDIDRVTALVAEMEQAGLPLSGSIFFVLFKAFAMHGGLLYSAWTRARLEAMYDAFVGAVAARSDSVWVGLPLAQLCLSAFARCADMQTALKVRDELDALWQPSEAERAQIDELLAQLARKADEEPGGGIMGRRARRKHFYLR